MSRKPSTGRQPRSSGAGTRAAAPSPEAIVAAGEVLSGRGVFGLAWLDGDLVVRSRYGRLAQFIVVGEPVTETLLPLFGLEEQIKAVCDGAGFFEVPSVSIKMPEAPRDRLNLTILWAPRARRYLLLIARATATTELELQLTQQIRARLMAETDATALSRQLARANRDLEEFASIISHDLKAPMRAMRILTEDAEAALGLGDREAVRMTLARVREQSVRLNAMLTALFDYSRAGYKGDVIARVDLRAMVETIVRSLPQRPGLDIEIAGAWPVIDTLAAPLDLVVRNLIDNAVKHHDRSEIAIVIGAAFRGDFVEISVSDDGPGIAPRYHQAIFLPFRRLAEIDDPASSGMGLALAKRTVETAGGHLEVVSDPAHGRGTTFKVLWPRSIAA